MLSNPESQTSDERGGSVMHHYEFDIRDSPFEGLENGAVLRISNGTKKPSPRGSRERSE